MLHRLGSTQMQQEIQKRVIKLSREQEEVLKEQTGVEQQHLTDDEITQYVKDVMKEIQRTPRKQVEKSASLRHSWISHILRV
jgi:N-acetylglutamate synthase/N-acetylornithine aminotransferase